MSDRQFPVRPDLDQLKHQAKDLLRDLRRGDPDALVALATHHPRASKPTLAVAQHVLARSYGLPSWPRLVLACHVIDAIVRDDAEGLRALIAKHPRALHEQARGVPGSWGPPMSYAANLGRTRIVAMLRELGATDLAHAFDRACLQGQLATARRLFELGARPQPGAVMGPAETLNAEGFAFLLDLGAPLADEHGDPLAPVALVLQTYTRDPDGKHGCLELLAARGVALPDTPVMAVHRGRIDLLARHVERDPDVVHRTFAHHEIWPRALGCSEDPTLALHGTPLAGATLLHVCVDYDELELARWLLAHGADANARAAIDRDGFGGHTPLFSAVVSQAHRTRASDAFARLLLGHGADPSVRASLRKQLRFHDDESLHEYRDVTPLEWGERFHGRRWVSREVLALLRAAR